MVIESCELPGPSPAGDRSGRLPIGTPPAGIAQANSAAMPFEYVHLVGFLDARLIRYTGIWSGLPSIVVPGRLPAYSTWPFSTHARSLTPAACSPSAISLSTSLRVNPSAPLGWSLSSSFRHSSTVIGLGFATVDLRFASLHRIHDGASMEFFIPLANQNATELWLAHASSVAINVGSFQLPRWSNE